MLNDSGCLLGDSDLFDAQLEEDSEPQLEGEEEESLDAYPISCEKKGQTQSKDRLLLPLSEDTTSFESVIYGYFLLFFISSHICLSSVEMRNKRTGHLAR